MPVAVIAALLVQELLALNLAAALPAFLLAIFTKSLLGTVMIGVLSLMIVRFF
ncbi:AzlD domain-containing protein [Peribacillus simplex]|uniref:AzlD domain-containing protein n=2 Tax=Peribacillus TaxID=2675229 RepID=A0AA90PCC9_9BACI|nr:MULTISPECIES: AzlD domain-containing protein [Peribacillus]MDP1420427.1 AzlD domain-containing protein [Peribacillus simplex]MDP1453259.1 AzlD domain-containing protein [Peribacillus frigoritolerans]